MFIDRILFSTTKRSVTLKVAEEHTISLVSETIAEDEEDEKEPDIVACFAYSTGIQSSVCNCG